MSAFTESVVEQAALAWFEALGYAITGGPSIAPGEPGQERRTYADVVLDGRLREALARLNPTVSREGLDEAFRKLTRISSPQPVDANHELHYYLDGKAMLVCMSRRICVDLYKALTALRPDWHDESDDKGAIKVVMTGSASDPSAFQQHIRSKQAREALAKRFKNPSDPFKLVIVRDMWLTGFDAPCMHTMYIDKPMQGHGLIQAIARVNRVFRDKPGGLVVDYLGLADQLKKALHTYTESGGQGETALDQEEAVALMLERYEQCSDLFHGFDSSAWMSSSPAARLSVLPAAQEHVLAQESGKERLLQFVTELSKAFALAVPHDEAIRIRDDVGFFQAVRTAIAKTQVGDRKGSGDIDHAIRQIVSKAIVSDQVIDIFAAAGLKNPDISILSDQFLADVRGMKHRNLAVELLRKLLSDEVKARSKHSLVQARSFADLLEKSVRRYQNRAIEAAQVIEELIELAKEMRAAQKRGEELGLSSDERAFYDALEVSDTAVKVLGDETLRTIARELVDTVKHNGEAQRHHRLDREGVGPCQAAGHRQAHPAQVRLPARQAGGRDQHGAAAGRVAVGLLDESERDMTSAAALASTISYQGQHGSACREGRHVADAKRFARFVRDVVRPRVVDEPASFGPDLGDAFAQPERQSGSALQPRGGRGRQDVGRNGG
jgi:type I restriction enzyme R subunit